jgi:hypothetical protein
MSDRFLKITNEIKNIGIEKRVGEILCYSIEPTSNTLYILLGREQHIKNWDEGSLKWSGFGGLINTNESIEHGTAREFVEETLGVVNISDQSKNSPNSCVNNYESISDVTKMLIDMKYDKMMRIKNGDNFIIYRFIKEIKWNPYLPQKFNKCRTILKLLKDKLKLYKYVMRMYGSQSVELIKLEEELIKYVESLPDYIKTHPALNFKYNNNIIYQFQINKCFLEKNKLEWWSITKLRINLKKNIKIFRPTWAKYMNHYLNN